MDVWKNKNTVEYCKSLFKRMIGKMWKKKKIGQKGRRKIEKQFLELAKALAS